ncbi:MAG TPA: isoprenyl transferase [Candidatus Polarisedimenticolia bacterium]|jgi:undecaprenyl diphosphate synthase
MPRRTPDLEGYIAPDSEEESIAAEIDFLRLPAHVAIIMDGNGRWAQSRRLPRVAGHRAGIDAVRDIVEASARLGLQVLTLYAFSKENWKRPKTEINVLMALLKEYLNRELNTLISNDIRFNVIGRMEELEQSVQRELRRGMEATKDLRGMVFNIALSYGGRAEIVDACRGLFAEIGTDGADRIDEQTFAKYLYTAGQPDPDLLIRTSGELRISNFLLWQIAYAEIWVTPTHWPDFRKKELLSAIRDYQKRDRRYGGVSGSPEAPGVRRVV